MNIRQKILDVMDAALAPRKRQLGPMEKIEAQMRESLANICGEEISSRKGRRLGARELTIAVAAASDVKLSPNLGLLDSMVEVLKKLDPKAAAACNQMGANKAEFISEAILAASKTKAAPKPANVVPLPAAPVAPDAARPVIPTTPKAVAPVTPPAPVEKYPTLTEYEKLSAMPHGGAVAAEFYEKNFSRICMEVNQREDERRADLPRQRALAEAKHAEETWHLRVEPASLRGKDRSEKLSYDRMRVEKGLDPETLVGRYAFNRDLRTGKPLSKAEKKSPRELYAELSRIGLSYEAAVVFKQNEDAIMGRPSAWETYSEMLASGDHAKANQYFATNRARIEATKPDR